MSVPASRPDPDYLPALLAELPSREVLIRLERAFEAALYITDEKLIAPMDPRQYPTIWQNLLAAWGEAYRRGYSEQDVNQAITSLARVRGFIQQLHEETGSKSPGPPDPAWRRLERVVAEIHRLNGPDWSVMHNIKLPDRTTGTPRQIDVAVRFKKELYQFLIVIECRDQQSNISIDDLDAFARKVADVGANKGVLVATSDFSPAAKQKAAFFGIDLCTLAQALQIEWQPHIRQIVFSFAFPEKVTFIPVVEGALAGAPAGSYDDLSFADFILMAADQRVDDLARMLWRVSLQLAKDRTRLPANVHVDLEPPLMLVVDRFGIRVALKAIETTMILLTRSRELRVERPALERRVRYRNVTSGVEREFLLAPEPPPSSASATPPRPEGEDEAQEFERNLRELKSLIRSPLQVKGINPLVLTTGQSGFRFDGILPPSWPCANEKPLAVGDVVFLTGVVWPTGQIGYTAPCGCLHGAERMIP